MKVVFDYDKEKDVWCILNKGKSSNNSPEPTKVYKQLVTEYGGVLNEQNTSEFIEKYIIKNNIDIDGEREKFQKEWDVVSDEYQKRAEVIFQTKLPTTIKAYLTINNRCPYNIEDNYFYVSVQSPTVNRTVMHELWHFYTWYALGPNQVKELGVEKYNNLKEALTVLLNAECKDLLPEGVEDNGYPQHKELRKDILVFWKKNKNIKSLWEYLVSK